MKDISLFMLSMLWIQISISFLSHGIDDNSTDGHAFKSLRNIWKSSWQSFRHFCLSPWSCRSCIFRWVGPLHLIMCSTFSAWFTESKIKRWNVTKCTVLVKSFIWSEMISRLKIIRSLRKIHGPSHILLFKIYRSKLPFAPQFDDRILWVWHL